MTRAICRFYAFVPPALRAGTSRREVPTTVNHARREPPITTLSAHAAQRILTSLYNVPIMKRALFAGQGQGDIAESDGDSRGEQWVRAVNHMKMQVRLSGIAGMPQSGDRLASLDVVTGMNPRASWQEMCVEGVL